MNAHPLIIAFDMDGYGNKIVTIWLAGYGRVRTDIQTNQNLPKTHRMTALDMDYPVALQEIRDHVEHFGTPTQKKIMAAVAV